jgi:nitrogen fixation protein FixH
MKFNWGTGVALAFSIFAVGMVLLVIAARQHDPGLMQEDYYALDLNYQDRLDRSQNTASLATQLQLTINSVDKSLSIQFPAGMERSLGTAKFYRSTTIKDDFLVKFDNGQPLQVSTSTMAPGRWHVELEWTVVGEKYFWETAFVVPGK